MRFSEFGEFTDDFERPISEKARVVPSSIALIRKKDDPALEEKLDFFTNPFGSDSVKALLDRNPDSFFPCLVWSIGEGKQIDEEGDKRIIERFVKLKNGSPDRIYKFAQKYGVLEICQHELPSNHFNIPINSDSAGYCFPCGVEPVSIWAEYAKVIHTIILIARSLRLNKVGEEKDWKVLRPNRPGSIKEARQVLSRIVNHLILVAGVTNDLIWIDEEPKVKLSGSGVLGGVVRQLPYLICRGSESTFCYGCGKLFQPYRWPRAGEKSWCENCGSEAARRESAKLANRRRRKAKEMILEGIRDPERIVQETGCRLRTAIKWIETFQN
jgi:hypothetical protein